MQTFSVALVGGVFLVVGSPPSQAQIGETGRAAMSAEQALWHAVPAETRLTPRVRGWLEWARNLGVEPALLTTDAGELAVLVPCRPSLEALTASLPSGEQAAIERTASGQCGDWLAIVDLVPGPEAVRLVRGLADNMRDRGQTLGIVALPEAGQSSNSSAPSGLELIAGPPVRASDEALRLHRAPAKQSLEQELTTKHPGRSGEPPGHLEQREKWFQRRTGGRD